MRDPMEGINADRLIRTGAHLAERIDRGPIDLVRLRR